MRQSSCDIFSARSCGKRPPAPVKRQWDHSGRRPIPLNNRHLRHQRAACVVEWCRGEARRGSQNSGEDDHELRCPRPEESWPRGNRALRRASLAPPRAPFSLGRRVQQVLWGPPAMVRSGTTIAGPFGSAPDAIGPAFPPDAGPPPVASRTPSARPEPSRPSPGTAGRP
jgi:hypothetical protein